MAAVRQTPVDPSIQAVVLVNPTTGEAYTASGGSGSGGDASAANQLLQLAQETAINTALGTVTASPTANTLLARVKDLLTGIVLAAGNNLIGIVSIDQTTPGTTNAVSIVGRITKTDRSGTITTGGTAQTLMAASSSRLGWQLQNNSSQDLWFNEIGGTAIIGQPSFRLVSGAVYESPVGSVSVSAISIIGSTTAQQFTAREW